MSEHNNHRDPIEEFFRNKTGEYDISYREEDWNRLEHKLDLRSAHRTYRNRVRWITAAAVLLVSLLGYFTYYNYNRLNSITEQLDSDTQLEIPDSPPAEFIPPTDHELELPDINTQDLQAGIQPDDTEYASEELISADVRTDLRNEFTRSIGFVSAEVLEREFITTTLNDTKRDQLPVLETELYRGESSAQTPILALNEGTISYLDDTEDQPGRFSLSRFSIGIAGSPDMSTVNSVSNFYEPGYKFGLYIEYAVNSRLTVRTGYHSSLVKYSAGNSDYNPPVYWSESSTPEEMVAECLLFDIPIEFKFDIIKNNRSRFYATAGLSSYFMVREDYYFSYADEVQTDQLESWSGRTGTRHWFSNAGFSIGYEMDLHTKWSLSAEPYIKVPLKEVGWGNVNLYSIGSTLSIRYRL